MKKIIAKSINNASFIVTQGQKEVGVCPEKLDHLMGWKVFNNYQITI